MSIFGFLRRRKPTKQMHDLLDKGQSLFTLGRYEESLDCAEEVLRLDLDYGDAWYNLAKFQPTFGEKSTTQ